MSKKKHHHGDLREALIMAGIEMLEDGGIEALSLRKCAAKAGVSHAAPAHHFNGLVSLKAAIIARCYHIFSETMLTHSRNAKAAPRSQLLAICEGYLAFCRAHEPLFQIMFQPKPEDLQQINPRILEELEKESTKAFIILQTACAPFAPVGAHEQGTEVMVWSLVHGYATLFARQPDGETPAGALPEFANILPELPLRK